MFNSTRQKKTFLEGNGETKVEVYQCIGKQKKHFRGKSETDLAHAYFNPKKKKKKKLHRRFREDISISILPNIGISIELVYAYLIRCLIIFLHLYCCLGEFIWLFWWLVSLLNNKHHMDSTGDSTLYIAHKNAQIILVKILSSSQANDKLIRLPIKATHRETSLRGPNIRK